MVLVITIAGWVMNNTGTVRDWLDDNIKNPIAAVIVGGEYASPDSVVDAALLMMHLIMGLFGGLQASTGSENGGAFAAFVMGSGIAQGAPAVVAGSLLLLNQIAVSLCILTAPAFILCLLYEPTKPYFQGWLKFFLGALLTMAVLSVMVTIGLKVVLVYAAKVLGEYGAASLSGMLGLPSDKPGIAQITLMQGGLGLMMSTLMITAPMLVGQLVGSSLGFSPYSPFGQGAQARGADGAPQGGVQAAQQNHMNTEKHGNPVSDPARQNLIINQNQQIGHTADIIKPAGKSQRGAAL